MRTLKILLVATLAAAAAPASAAESPRPGLTDPHIQTTFWNPDQVIWLKGRFGFQTMIEFGDDERIENVAIGDALGWQVTPNKRANKLFVKPVAPRAVTNMTVVTDRRTYTFALLVGAPGKVTPWTLRFRYPDPVVVQAVVVPKPVIDIASFNHNYTVVGVRDLLPADVYDDGRQTYFTWPANVAAPAIFGVAADGREELVNYVIRDGATVVQQTAGRFILRSGKAAATVTSTPGSGPVRIESRKGVKK